MDLNNKWKVVDIGAKEINKALSVKEEVNCKKTMLSNDFFKGSYCSHIWNSDTKKVVKIEQSWSCP